MWLVEDLYEDDGDEFIKSNLAVQVLDSYEELHQLKDCHWGMIESIYLLANNNKLKKFKKKISWGQYIYSFFG